MSFYNGILNHDDIHKSSQIHQRGLPGVGFKLDDDGNYDIENKKLTNVQNGDMDHDVMTKNQIEGYVGNKTQYLNGVNPGQVVKDKAVIYSNSGSIHSNSLYLKDQYGQETIFHNEDQDDNQIRLYIPNLKNNDSYGGRLKSSIMVSSIPQTIEGKKVFHNIEVPNPTIDGHASNKAYVDNEISKISDASDNSNYVKKSGDTMTGKLLLPNVLYPLQGDLRQAVSYESLREIFLSRRENRPMRTNLDMDNHTIDNVKNAISDDQAINKGHFDNELNLKADKSNLLEYLKTNGSYSMKGNLQMGGNRITGLNQVPFYSGEAVNKQYVDNQIDSKANKSDLNAFLKINGDNMMTNNLRMNGHRILGISETPENNYEASNKKYVDDTINKANIKPSHTQKNTLKYIMDDIDQTSSEYGIEIDKIDNLNESFHSYNKQVIYLKLIKDGNEYEARIGYNIYQLVDKTKDRYYTAVIEWLTPDNNAWNKMEIFNNITEGSIISNQTNKFEDGKGMYYTRSIIQFKVFKISTAPIYLLSTIHIESVNPTYPAKFDKVYNIIYGINGKTSNVNSYVYDSHEAYEIEKTKMKMLVDIDMNNKKISNLNAISNAFEITENDITFLKNINMNRKEIHNTRNLKNYVYGRVNDNKSFTAFSFEISLENIFIYTIKLASSLIHSNKEDTLRINQPGLLDSYHFGFRFPSSPGIVEIEINRHFTQIISIRLKNTRNIPFKITYI